MRQALKMAARAAIALALWCGTASRPARSETAEGVCSAGAKLANLNLTLKDIHGKPFNLSDYKGKVVVLDFWATWCPPCLKEIPGIIKLYDTYKSRGLVVIGISMDESTSDVKRFARRLKINYPILLGYGRDDLEPAFGELPLPTSFVLARDGRICGKHDGLTAKEQLEREISVLF
ncbi:MAG TPA: TlpA disulfide reductase family protein [Bryobacteraceae bacterium]|jgi:peroxiredoxin|nr:TlpA disulfide reductase family protein [Bryobacteraceae bacterium]